MKKKAIILLTALLMVCLSLASAALAEKVNDKDYTVSDLLYQSNYCSTDFFLVELAYQKERTTALPMNTNKVIEGDVFHAYMFDEDNQFLPLEGKLRWLVNNSLINGNKTAAEVKDAINALASKTVGLDIINDKLSRKDAVAGAEAALINLVSPTKAAAFAAERSAANFWKVFFYYSHMLENGASEDLVLPDAPVLSIDVEEDSSKSVGTVTISGEMFKVLPYVYSHSNNGDVALSITTAPVGSYIDDDTGSEFNVYVPVASSADAEGATITVLGTITATTTYMDICTYSATNKGGSILLGEQQFTKTYQAQDTDTNAWIFPKVFVYELTLLGKQSGDPVAGVEFTFSNDSGFSFTDTTDSSGKIYMGFTPCGTYYLNINETSAANAKLDTSLDEYGLFTTPTGLLIDSTAPGTYKKTLEITELPASICLYKYCDTTDLPLPFAVFGLFDGSSRTPIAQATSDANGRILFENLYPGNGKVYTVKETTNPVGYVGTYTKNIQLFRGQNYDTSTFKEKCFIFNKPVKVSITAFVKDEINLAPIKDATVAIYEGDYSTTPLPSGSVPLVYGVTDSNGKTILSGLKFDPSKKFTILQTATIAGYNIDVNKYLLDLASIQLSTEVTFFNAPNKGTINVEIITTQANDYYDGMEFLLIGAPEYPSTEQNRVGTIASLATSYTTLYPGTYKLHQVVPPVGYTEDTTVDLGISVTLAPGETKTITLQDTDLYDEGNVSLLKTDDSQDPLQGAQFNLYVGSKAELDAMSAAELDMSLLTTAVTDAAGLIEFGQFRPGTYTAVEVASPAGYAMPTENRFEVSFEDGNVVIGPVVNVYDPSVTATPAPTATTPPDIPETGEGSFLYIAAAIFALVGIALLIFRKKILNVAFKNNN